MDGELAQLHSAHTAVGDNDADDQYETCSHDVMDDVVFDADMPQQTDMSKKNAVNTQKRCSQYW